MKLLVGLGNPGREYENTRHNAGFLVVDMLTERHAPGAIARGKFSALTIDAIIGDEKILLLKPTTFMNRSGRSVAEAINFYKLDPTEDVLVIVDEVALPVGSIRLRARGSAGGHNGLSDIERYLGTDAYCRCRIGIDPPGIIPQADYVLGKFTEEQRVSLGPALKASADAAELWIREGITSAMNRYNEKAGPKPDHKPEAEPEADTPSESATKNKSTTPQERIRTTPKG